MRFEKAKDPATTERLSGGTCESVLLRRITCALVMFMLLSFSIRVVGMLFPSVFHYEYAVELTIIINTAFSIFHLLFYLFFLKEYAAGRQQSLKVGTSLAIVGSLLVAFIYMKNIDLVFDLDLIPSAWMSRHYDAVVPIAASCFILIFFIVFRKALLPEEGEDLARATASALVGVGIFLILHMVVLVNFLKFKKFLWLEHMPRAVAVGTVPLVIIAASCLLFFYFKFYRYLSVTPGKTEKIMGSVSAF